MDIQPIASKKMIFVGLAVIIQKSAWEKRCTWPYGYHE